MKEKIKHYAKEIAIFFVVMSIFANIISFYKSTDLNKTPLDIKNLTLLDGSKYTIKTDKPILIHFWVTWCPTCKLEISNIETISKNFQVITIAVKSGSDNEINKFLNEHNLDLKVVNDSKGAYANKLNISVFPTTLIYKKNKELIFSDVGYTSTIALWLRLLWAGV
jgi:thiol-disulfide isomerase/thioredoxin